MPSPTPIAVVAALTLLAPLAGAAGSDPSAIPPAVPPQKAAKGLEAVPLSNAGFEIAKADAPETPDAWILMQHAGEPAYVLSVDADKPRAGRRSGRLQSIRSEVFGSVSQALPAAPWRGRTLRFSGWMRTRDVEGNDFGRGAGMFLNSMKGGYPLVYSQMQANAVQGTTEWTRYEVLLKVPDDADTLEIGFIVYGPGTAWFDDAALDVVAAR